MIASTTTRIAGEGGRGRPRWLAFGVVGGLFVFLASVSAAATTDTLRIEANVAADQYNIGDRIEYTVTVDWKAPVELIGIEPSPELNEFEILRSPEVTEKKLRRGWRRRLTRYLLSTFETGEFTIPEFTVVYRDGEAGEKRVPTPPVRITVNSVAPSSGGDEEIRPAKDPVLPPSAFPTRAVLTAVAVAVVLAAIAGFLIVRAIRKRRGTLLPAEPPRPIDEVAREQLARIADSDLLAQGLIKEYFDQVSDVIRDYLGRRYGFCGIVTTTSELLESLRDPLSDDGRLELVAEFSGEADMAKFARWKPDTHVCGRFLETAYRVIDETTPRSTTTETTAAEEQGRGDGEQEESGRVQDEVECEGPGNKESRVESEESTVTDTG